MSLTTTNAYINFFSTYGQPAATDLREQMPHIFTTDCQKIMNGKVVGQGFEGMHQQLLQARQGLGTWEMQIQAIMPSPETDSCVLRYDLITQKLAILVAVTILKFDGQGLITELEVICAQKEQ